MKYNIGDLVEIYWDSKKHYALIVDDFHGQLGISYQIITQGDNIPSWIPEREIIRKVE